MSDSHQIDDLDSSELDEETLRRARQGQRVLIILLAILVIGVGITLAIIYAPKEEDREEKVPESTAPTAPPGSTESVPAMPFKDVTKERGIEFVHVNGAEGEKLLPETMGSGAVFFDYDGDGDSDLFLVNSAPWAKGSPGDASATQRLYRNDQGSFVDVTKEAGLGLTFYGMGAAAADMDEDGDPDLFVTCVGENRLFRNDDGKFVDVTDEAGVGGGNRWSTGTTFLDYDRDGKLDLFVCNYVVWSRDIDLVQGFKIDGRVRSYGPPKSFKGESAQLFRNLGGGRFEEVTGAAGLAVKNPATGAFMAKSLGVIVCDWNRDGWSDLVVSNDTVQNFAFINNGQGGFNEVGAEIGVAFDDKGNARGAMGIDIAAHRNDKSTAIAIGNFANEMTAFYVDPGDDPTYPNYVDEATTTGIGSATRNSLTFGLVFADIDLDGRLDLLAVNGHVEPDIKALQASQDHEQPAELFWNAGPDAPREFLAATAAEAGEDFFRPMVGRGLAMADIDGDGDLDLLFTANAGEPRLLLNEQVGGKSLRLDLRMPSGRVAWGARVQVAGPEGTQERYLGGGRSYLSQSETVLTFGMGAEKTSGAVTITWPNGAVQKIASLAVGSHRFEQPAK